VLSPLELYKLQCMLASLEHSPVLAIHTRDFCSCSALQLACIPEAVVCWLACVLFTWMGASCLRSLPSTAFGEAKATSFYEWVQWPVCLPVRYDRKKLLWWREQQHGFRLTCESQSWLGCKCCTVHLTRQVRRVTSPRVVIAKMSPKVLLYVSEIASSSLIPSVAPWAESCHCCLDLWDLLGLVLVAKKSWGRKSFASCWFMALVYSPEKHSEIFLDFMQFQLSGSSRLLFDHVE